MGTIEVRDHALWIKHIHGDAELSAFLMDLPPGALIWLKVGETEGEWSKMAVGPTGTATPGLKPMGTLRAEWHLLQSQRGARLPIARCAPRAPDKPAKMVLSSPVAPTSHSTLSRVPLPEPVSRIYAAVEELEAAYPGRKFTPDGHLVGSIGEVVAAEALGLTLHPASYPGHDAVDATGRQVQIKLTRGSAVSLYACCERLVVLRVVSPSEAEIAYDGEGQLAWDLAGPVQKNGQRVVTLAKLRRAASAITE